MAAVRESFFPAIKCSMCNADVEISQMGDHICFAESEEPKYSIFPLSKNKSSAKGAQAQKLASLPRIDPNAANRPFRGQDQLTPLSSSTGSGGRSPSTPRDDQPLRTPLHNSPLPPHPQGRNFRKGSGTSSVYNIDSPFPPFKSPRISPMSPHALPARENEFYHAPLSPATTGGRNITSRMNNIAPGPFGVNHNNSSRERLHEILPVASSSFPERSSSRTTKANAEPLPASYSDREDERRKKRDEIERDSTEYVATRREGRDRDRGREQEEEIPRRTPASSDYVSRAMRMRSQSPGSRQPPKERNVPAVPLLNAFGQRGGRIRAEEPRGQQSRYSDTVPSNLKVDGLRPEARSNTFPNTNHERSPSGRFPPHPGVGLPRSPSVTVGHKKNKSSTNLSKVLPAPPQTSLPDIPKMDKRGSSSRRKPSLSSSKFGEDKPQGTPLQGREVSPPRPKPPLVEARPPARRLSPQNPNAYSTLSTGNSYEIEAPVEGTTHNASPSMSSNASSIFSHRSERSSTSATSSPPTPDVSALRDSGSKFNRDRRRPSNAASKTSSNGFNDIDGLMKELQNSIHDLVPTPVREGFEERSLPAPQGNTRRPSYDYRQVPPTPAPPAPLKTTPPAPAPLQRQPPPPGVYQQPPPPRLASSESLPRALQYPEQPPVLRRKQSIPLGSPVEELFLPPPPPVPPVPQQQQQKPTRRPTTSKGNCRGCGEGIIGKSISSADGRLTGRYHKACFVCQDCRKLFESAEFYVHNNLPYCERHYHKLNQSLCPTCDRGIEGPCLETEQHERYHPSCFSCSECACALGGDYFELNGRPYCEQHAFQMMQGTHLGPSRMANMERRRTRMMFM